MSTKYGWQYCCAVMVSLQLQLHDVVGEGLHDAVDVHQHPKGRELMTLTVVMRQRSLVLIPDLPAQALQITTIILIQVVLIGEISQT